MGLSGPAAQLADVIRAGRRERRARPALAERLDIDLAQAYQIQSALLDGQPLAGYKFGLISRAKQAQMGIDTPIYGRVMASMLHDGAVSLSQFIQPRIEPELAVVLRADLPPDATPGLIEVAVGATFLAVDILDSVWQDYRFSIADVVADNASAGGFLLGERALDWPGEGDLRLFLNGTLIAEGSVSLLGGSLARLGWLAREVGGLKAGQVVFLGSPAAAAPAAPGLLELYGPAGSVLLARLEA